jgi:hypothetical protein
VNGSGLELPPGVGFATDTNVLPANARSVLGTAAVSWAALTKVVVRVSAPHFTTAPATNCEPLTVSMNAPLPASATAGDSDATVGGGLAPLPLLPPAPPLDDECPPHPATAVAHKMIASRTVESFLFTAAPRAPKCRADGARASASFTRTTCGLCGDPHRGERARRYDSKCMAREYIGRPQRRQCPNRAQRYNRAQPARHPRKLAVVLAE